MKILPLSEVKMKLSQLVEEVSSLDEEITMTRHGKPVVGSTDMGNVSYLVPSIHPMIQVAPAGVPIHTLDFAHWAASSNGDRAVIDGAKALAMTIVDLWCQPGLMDSVQAAFAQRPTGVEVL